MTPEREAFFTAAAVVIGSIDDQEFSSVDEIVLEVVRHQEFSKRIRMNDPSTSSFNKSDWLTVIKQMISDNFIVERGGKLAGCGCDNFEKLLLEKVFQRNT